MKPADIIGVQGRGWLSDHIRLATGPGPLSHVAMCISAAPPIVIEALTRVRTRPLAATLNDARRAWLIESLTLTDEQRAAIVNAACHYSADSYGYVDIAWQGLDALCRTRWFTRNLAETGKPICSMLVGLGYEAAGLTFGVDDRSLTPNDVWNFAGAGSGVLNKYRIIGLK